MHLPDGVRVLAATRRRPDINLPRLLVAGDLLELHPDDLRFRSWEVEELFRDIYGEPLPPGDLAVLARRTEGWAAGLQLFHLACRGRSPAERHRLLASLGTHFALASEYLARNVLADLEHELSEFLLQTCVLGQLTGELCDELLDASGSQAHLAALAERQVFTHAVDGTTAAPTATTRCCAGTSSSSSSSGSARPTRASASAAPARCSRAGARSPTRSAPSAARRTGSRSRGSPHARASTCSRSATGGSTCCPRRCGRTTRGCCSPSPGGSAPPAASTPRSPPTARPRRRSASPTGADLARRERQSLVRLLDPLAPGGLDFAGIVRAATVRDPVRAAARADGPLARLRARLRRGARPAARRQAARGRDAPRGRARGR